MGRNDKLYRRLDELEQMLARELLPEFELVVKRILTGPKRPPFLSRRADPIVIRRPTKNASDPETTRLYLMEKEITMLREKLGEGDMGVPVGLIESYADQNARGPEAGPRERQWENQGRTLFARHAVAELKKFLGIAVEDEFERDMDGDDAVSTGDAARDSGGAGAARDSGDTGTAGGAGKARDSNRADGAGALDDAEDESDVIVPLDDGARDDGNDDDGEDDDGEDDEIIYLDE